MLVGTLMMICFSGSLGLGTVWLRHEISLAANRNRQLEAQLTEVERRVDANTAAIAAEQSPDTLVRRNAEWRLGLVPPREAQVVRVADDVERRLAAKNRAGLFALEVQPALATIVFNLRGGR